MSIEIKSFNQILGGMVRKIIAETPLSDVNPGSVFLSLLEACASQDFDNNVAILSILELLNVDAIRNNDLDNKAADLGLERKAAVAATGTVRIKNTNIVKQSTSLYSLKPAPISGQTVLFVNNTSGWTASGSLYIGRGTNSFEGPIVYTSITTYPTYSEITLGTALQKDHLASDLVVNAQGQPDRVINAGTIVKIPANNQNPEIVYNTIRDAVIPAGEDYIDDVLVVAQSPGTQGNALLNTINQFDTVPFIGAAVTNTVAFTTGSDIETDVELRNRIKAYASSLARGTAPSILSAVIGLSDPDENKRVASAILSQPVSVNAPSILYIDDGRGFQPSQAGQAIDVLLARANGTEEFLQLANYPVPRVQVVNDASGPFELVDQMFLRVAVDGVEETIIFTETDFSNISVATLAEIVSAINDKSISFKARLTDDSSHILLFAIDPDAETIQVAPIKASDNEALYSNNILNFPVKEVSYIALFQNSTRLRQREKTATVETIPFAFWNLLSTGDLGISVDGTPTQTQTFSLSDFPNASSFSLLTIDDWVSAFNRKFAGITASSTPNQTMQISSNKQGSTATVEIVGGSYKNQMFGANAVSATGQSSQFEINRSTGNIRLLTDVVSGDVVSAGIADAKGFIVSTVTTSGLYNFDVDTNGRQAQMVICSDASICKKIDLDLSIDQTLVITNQGSSVMRIKADNIDTFRYIQPGHYLYMAYRSVGSGWINQANSGLFKVIRRGAHTNAGTDTYIEVLNGGIIGETVTVADITDMVAFQTDVYPQLWTSSYLTNPLAASLDDVASSINDSLIGIKASIFRTNSVKITSTTEESGSIAIPVSIGAASTIFIATEDLQVNNDPLIANKISSKDMTGFIKFPAIISSNTYLGRATYPTVFASLSASAVPDAYPYSGAYSETLTAAALTDANVNLSNIVSFERGSNEGLTRSIAAKPTNTTVGTQQGLPRTLFDHVINDKVQVYNSLQMAQDDNIVIAMDKDVTTKTITIPIARTGRVNSGSNLLSFIPNSTEFSASDNDNEPGVDFSTVNVWGTSLNGTDFSDYRLLMRARNWYASGGTTSGNGKFMVRSAEFGTNGNLFRFAINYPALPNLDNTTVLSNTPSHNQLVYKFASGSDRTVGLGLSTVVSITGPYSNDSINFPGGASDGPSGEYFDLAWGTGNFTTVQVNDVLSTFSGSGFSGTLLGQFGIKAKSGNTIRIFHPSGVVGSVTVTNPDLVHFFPLQKTTVADIISKINESNILVAAAISLPSASIVTSTLEDQYNYTTDATALGHDHNPTDVNVRSFVSLFDGVGDIRSFSNANPNFTLKTGLVLPSTGVSSSIYRMDTTVNEDSTVGEYFKLVPSTIKNIHHHFTQKALSQLPIVADVSIANNNKRVQIVSKELGSKGAIEILGGQGNVAQTSIIGQSIVTSDTSGSYLLASISAFPNTYSVGDVVKVTNSRGVQRATQFASSSTLDVSALVSNRAEYYWNPVTTNFGATTTFAITDVSSSYTDYNGSPLSAGIVWRWTHSIGNAETLSAVQPGQQVIAFDCTGWKNTNQAKLPGDGTTVGLIIINVNDVSHYFDVVNPFGQAMGATAIGTGTVSICPVPRNRWNLAHASPTPISSLQRASNVITVQTTTSHNMNSGDSAVINDSLSIVADGTYGPITVTGPQTFTFADTGPNLTELNIGATTIKSTFTRSSYRLQKMGFGNLVQISHTTGDSPRFADCGVAVDDYLILQGKTFNSSNNGVYRIVAVDNTSIVFEHKGAIDNRNLTTLFNQNSIAAQWTANSNIVEGSAGTFKHLVTGRWVKKEEDSDALYLQVTGCDTNDYSTATKIFLGQTYNGVTGSALGISYNMVTSYDLGVYLDTIDDILIYEGDSAFKTDKLNVQTVTDATWFDPNNTGQFDIIEIGNNPSDRRPFVRVNNAVAVTQINRQLSATPQGFYVVENDTYKYSTYRTVANSVISDTNNLRRNLYLLPDARAYKIDSANDSIIQHVGKLGYDLITATGTDGYLFYTGLLRRVQRTVDGFSPDPITYAERRAVGSRIEILPPLIKNISLVLTITTNEGSSVQDVSNNVKSSIIDYVNGLGVGDDVILSAIIAAVMKVKGVAAATFNSPVPSTERITIASNEKALIFADMIGII
jgi:uncharacterized phage protein gp47/JayE